MIMTTTQKLKAFRNAKRTGDVTTVATKTGYSIDMASKTLRGVRNNETIVNAAYRLVRGRKAAQLA